MLAVFDDLNNLIAKILWMGSHIAYPLNALYLVYHLQKLGKGCLFMIFAIGVYILSQQSNLLVALSHSLLYLPHNILWQSAALPASYIRNYAIGAKVVTAIHNRNPGGKGCITLNGHILWHFAFPQLCVHHMLYIGSLQLLDSANHLMNFIGTQYEINMWCTLD